MKQVLSTQLILLFMITGLLSLVCIPRLAKAQHTPQHTPAVSQHETQSPVSEEHPQSEESHGGVHLTLLHWIGRIFNTAGLFFLLYYLIFKMGRVPEALAQKRKELEEEIESARKQLEGAREQLKNVQEQMEHLEKRIEELQKEAEEEAEEEEKKIVEQSQQEVERLKKMAHEEIERAYRFALAELKRYTAELAIRMSETMLQMEVDEKENEKLLLKALERFENQLKERQS